MAGEKALSGKYAAYPEYKESGVQWLGEIPKQWELKRIKETASLINGYPFDSKQFEAGKGMPLVRIRDIKVSKTEVGFTGDVPPESLIDNGDVLVGMDGDFNVSLWSGGQAALNQRVACVRVKNYHLRKFIFYVLPFNMKVINDLTYFTTVKHLSSIDILKTNYSLPPHNELNKVVAFLDHETAKIDTLIEKQQQLIKLLKEKRQAVISHAVTKGLNSNAPMRDSGVEWLGEVPEHWSVSKFGYISQVVRGGSPRPAGDPALFDGDYSPWVTVAEITKDDDVYLTETETFLTKKGSDQCRIFTSDTLLLSNSGATLGVPSILKIDANANDGVVGFEDLKLNNEFAYYYLSTLTNGLRERIKQGSGQPNLNTEIVKDIVVPVPPEDEVTAIVDSIRRTRNHYKKLEEKAVSGIELLQERRTALISAAVTGKIDVRNWRAP
jgi:type I restriction enzyme S subunit